MKTLMLVERPPREVEGKEYLVRVPLATLLDWTDSSLGMVGELGWVVLIDEGDKCFGS